MVWKLDRLARSLKQLIEIIEDLERRNIGFLSLTENINTANAGGKLIFQIFGALAEFERSLIRERTQAGLIVARKQGRVGGRSRSLFDKKIEIAKSLMKNSALTMKEIAENLNISEATFYRYFKGRKAAI